MHRTTSRVFITAILVISIVSVAATARPVFAQNETKGQAWSSMNSLVGDAEKTFETDPAGALAKVDEAQAKYESVFRSTAFEVDRATGEAMDKAFVDIRAAINSGSKIDVIVNKQMIDKLTYKVAFMKMEKSLDEATSSLLRESKVREAGEWYTVMTVKFGYAQNPSESSQAMAALQADPSRLQELTPVIIDGLKAQFTLKVKEEVTAVIGALSQSSPDTINAQKFAIEGIVYYRSIQPDAMVKLGSELEAELSHELEELFEVAGEGDLAQAKEIAEEINVLLLTYEGKETEGLGAALTTIRDMLELIIIEYRDAVADGEIVDQEEYDETLAFLDRAITTFEGVKGEMAGINADGTTDLEADFQLLSTMIDNREDPREVTELVEHMLLDLERDFGEGLEAKLDGWGYIDKIHELLDEGLAQFKAGSYEEARNTVRTAYLDNYEFIEADIAEDDRELMEKIEIDMRETLVRMIDQRRPVAEVEAHVQMIKSDLEVARAVVTPEFPLAALAAALSLGGTVAYTRFRTSFGRKA